MSCYRLQVGVGNEEGDIANVFEFERVELRFIKRGHRDRNLLNELNRTLPRRGYDHGLQLLQGEIKQIFVGLRLRVAYENRPHEGCSEQRQSPVMQDRRPPSMYAVQASSSSPVEGSITRSPGKAQRPHTRGAGRSGG